MTPTGRFAPSPTGELHFGSLVAAIASCLDARSRGGRWLVRVEDIDPPREVAGSADRILAALQRFGLRSDRPVVFQSQRRDVHRRMAERLVDGRLAYWCGCSRRDLPASGIYAGTCREGLGPGKSPRSVRLRVDDRPVTFRDRIQGVVNENLAETCGDFVIWRADDLPAYQLAVVVDDSFQGVTEVVRGQDLLSSTARQIHVARALRMPVPSYAHHPVVMASRDQKLSKRLASDPIAMQTPSETLAKALRFLGQPCPDNLPLRPLWSWALANWQIDRVQATPRFMG
ncbi:MAG: tRNA glutamyl-Q(34) synthetase GluQRS [Xanthomonadales bacterium]|nr:tRNA glutamyl-Q(34) synthetase GluQRS [Gammaproteobacteria bacterium]NNJ80073.1 tRNA glutamyl-Q(34) synthetase GluQRS [Xanthomonadales bacterium]NNL04526.1 tRNA glutamyl-Q(34) synthetase GluQRS [Xanthomonadales bacterium]